MTTKKTHRCAGKAYLWWEVEVDSEGSVEDGTYEDIDEEYEVVSNKLRNMEFQAIGEGIKPIKITIEEFDPQE